MQQLILLDYKYILHTKIITLTLEICYCFYRLLINCYLFRDCKLIIWIFKEILILYRQM